MAPPLQTVQEGQPRRHGRTGESIPGQRSSQRRNRPLFTANQTKTDFSRLSESLNKNGRSIFDNDKEAVSQFISAGSEAVPLLLRGLKQIEDPRDDKGVCCASVKLAIEVAEKDPRALKLFIDAMVAKSGPLGPLSEILQHFPHNPGIRAAFNALKDEGLGLRQEARNRLISLIGATDETSLSNLDLAVRGADAAISHILNTSKAEDIAIFLYGFRLSYPQCMQLDDQSTLSFMADLASMKARGTAYTKHAILALSKIGGPKDMLPIIDLIINESKEIREAAVYATLLWSTANQNRPSRIHPLCCRLLTTLSQDKTGNYEPIIRVLQGGPFTNSLRHVYINESEKLTPKDFNQSAYDHLLAVLFASFPDVRQKIYSYIPKEDTKFQPNVLSNALFICNIGFRKMQQGSIQPGEYEFLKSRITPFLASSDAATMELSPLAARALALASTLVGSASGAQIPLFQASTRPSSILVASENQDFIKRLESILENIPTKGNDKPAICVARTIKEAMNVVRREGNFLSCCIISQGIRNTDIENGDKWEFLIKNIKESGFYPGLILLMDIPEPKLEQKLSALGLEKGGSQPQFGDFNVKFVLTDSSEIQLQGRLHSLLEGFGSLETKVPAIKADWHATLDAYLTNDFFKSVKDKVFAGCSPGEIEQVLLNHGCILRQKTASKGTRRSLILLGPTAQITDIGVRGIQTLAVINHGTIIPDSAESIDIRHNARVSYRQISKVETRERRSNLLSKYSPGSVPVMFSFSGKPHRYSLSNRTSQGATILEVNEYCTSSKFLGK